MVIGVLQVELLIHDASNLKDKRRVVMSLKDRIGEPHNVAVAEVDALDLHRRAVLGIATVANDGHHARTVLDTIVEKLRHDPRVELNDHRIELLSGQ